MTYIIEQSIENMPKFKAYLEKENPGPKIDAQHGGQLLPLGFDRLKVVEWLHTLIQLKEPAILKKITEVEFPQLLLNLMDIYDMNSFLHVKIYNIFHDAITSGIEDFAKSVIIYYLSV